MFEYDICLCGNSKQCPLRNECLRAESHGPGIYTISLFYNPENEKCENYIKKEKQ